LEGRAAVPALVNLPTPTRDQRNLVETVLRLVRRL
jgi:hypothetical protein